MVNASPPSLSAFSADVEDYFQVEALRGICPREAWERFEDRTEASTIRLLDLLSQHRAHGTFFILGWTAERHPKLVRRIAEAGHEIGSHGYSHELIYNLSPEAFRQEVRRTRQLLQDLSGQEVIGYRAPSYTVVARTTWALEVLAEEGYLYDSSIYPIPRRRYGMPGAPRWPHRFGLGERGSIVEFPLPTVRCGFFNMPATGGAYLRLLPIGFQRWAVRRLIQKQRPFVLTIHPWELDPGQPRMPVGRRTRWTHYHNLERTAERLSDLLGLGSFRSQAEVLRDLELLDRPPNQAASLQS